MQYETDDMKKPQPANGDDIPLADPRQVRLHPEVDEAIERVAKEDDRTISSLIRRWVREGLARDYNVKL